MHSNDLTIELPAGNISDAGVHDVVNNEGIEDLYAVLREDTGNCSRRYKANQEKLASGKVLKAAEGSLATCRVTWPFGGRESDAAEGPLHRRIRTRPRAGVLRNRRSDRHRHRVFQEHITD